MRRLLILILALGSVLGPLAAAAPAAAEPFPAYQSLSVNDFADLLPAEAEAQIAADLDALRARTGIEMTVLTLESRAPYDPAPSLEAFATRLFNGWGIGDAARDDGILILVLSADREMRIELGAGYSPEYDIPAQDIVNRVMLPAFREGRMAEGIAAGTAATIRDIAERHAEGLPPAAPARSPRPAVLAAIGLLLAGVALALRHRIWARLGMLSRCPSCGHRGLERRRKIERRASRSAEGWGVRHQHCPACSWTEERPFTLPRVGSSSGGGGFGGGSSSGGGASGRW